MKFLFGMLALVFTVSAQAELKIIQVANGKALVQFDPNDAITTSSTLVLKELSVESTPTPLPVIENKPEYKRNHLITGTLESYVIDRTLKNGGTTTKAEIKVTELNASYMYNLKNFGLGITVFNKRESVDGFEDLSSSFGFNGRYFFLENTSKNKIVPYAGLQLVGLSSDLYDTPSRIEMKLSGSAIEFGAMFFLADAAFIDLNYSFGTAEGDVTQGTTLNNMEIEQRGLSVGVGIALE